MLIVESLVGKPRGWHHLNGKLRSGKTLEHCNKSLMRVV